MATSGEHPCGYERLLSRSDRSFLSPWLWPTRVLSLWFMCCHWRQRRLFITRLWGVYSLPLDTSLVPPRYICVVSRSAHPQFIVGLTHSQSGDTEPYHLCHSSPRDQLLPSEPCFIHPVVSYTATTLLACPHSAVPSPPPYDTRGLDPLGTDIPGGGDLCDIWQSLPGSQSYSTRGNVSLWPPYAGSRLDLEDMTNKILGKDLGFCMVVLYANSAQKKYSAVPL